MVGLARSGAEGGLRLPRGSFNSSLPVMEGDMDEVFHQIQGTLQDLHGDTKALSSDLKRMTARVDHMDESITKLLGAFAGIETILRNHERRIAELEQRSPPAA